MNFSCLLLTLAQTSSAYEAGRKFGGSLVGVLFVSLLTVAVSSMIFSLLLAPVMGVMLQWVTGRKKLKRGRIYWTSVYACLASTVVVAILNFIAMLLRGSIPPDYLFAVTILMIVVIIALKLFIWSAIIADRHELEFGDGFKVALGVISVPILIIAVTVFSAYSNRDMMPNSPAPFQPGLQATAKEAPAHATAPEQPAQQLPIGDQLANPGLGKETRNGPPLSEPGKEVPAIPGSSTEEKADERPAPAKGDAPVGYNFVTDDQQLVPGMPVKFHEGRFGSWTSGVILEINDKRVAIFPHNEGFGRSTEQVFQDRNQIAVERQAIEELKDPIKVSLFQELAKLQIRFKVPVPSQHVGVDEQTPLVRGTPLKLESNSNFENVVVSSVLSNKSTVKVTQLGKTWGRTDETVDRNKLLISRATVEDLKNPEKVKQFASEYRREMLGSGRGRDLYPITIPIHPKAVRIPKELVLKPDMKLGACYWNRWVNVIVLEVNEDGTVRIGGDRPFSSGDVVIDRENLIIPKADLAALQREAKAKEKESEGANASDKTSKSSKPVSSTLSKDAPSKPNK